MIEAPQSHILFLNAVKEAEASKSEQFVYRPVSECEELFRWMMAMENESADWMISIVATKRVKLGNTKKERQKAVETRLADLSKSTTLAPITRAMLAGIEASGRKQPVMTVFSRAIKRARTTNSVRGVKLRTETARLLVCHFESLQRGPAQFNEELFRLLMGRKH